MLHYQCRQIKSFSLGYLSGKQMQTGTIEKIILGNKLATVEPWLKIESGFLHNNNICSSLTLYIYNIHFQSNNDICKICSFFNVTPVL
jgi:hypothetical protein